MRKSYVYSFLCVMIAFFVSFSFVWANEPVTTSADTPMLIHEEHKPATLEEPIKADAEKIQKQYNNRKQTKKAVEDKAKKTKDNNKAHINHNKENYKTHIKQRKEDTKARTQERKDANKAKIEEHKNTAKHNSTTAKSSVKQKKEDTKAHVQEIKENKKTQVKNTTSEQQDATMNRFVQDKDGIITHVTLKEMHALSKKKGVIIFDARKKADYDKDHIENAQFLDIEYIAFEDSLHKHDKNAEYLVYDETGKRSWIAADAMKRAGYKKIYLGRASYTAWKKSGFPTSKK